MTRANARQAVDLLVAAMFCDRRSDRSFHSFTCNRPGELPFTGRLGFEVNYDDQGLIRTALFMRRNAAPSLRSLSVSDVKAALMEFVSNNFWAMEDEAWSGCLRNRRQGIDLSFTNFVSEETKEKITEIMLASELFVDPRCLFVFPLCVIRAKSGFECEDFCLIDPKALTLDRLPANYIEGDLAADSFPPWTRWEGARQNPTSWLCVWAASTESAKRQRAAILGAIALLPHRLERYLFTGREVFGGLCAFGSSMRLTMTDPHTPALGEDIVIDKEDRKWLNILKNKLRSSVTDDMRQMRALEYFYRAWIPDPARRVPILFAALDAIYGDAGAATSSVIAAVGPSMGTLYDFKRLKLLLKLRASVIHGGAPNVYESNSYQKYYEEYNEDAARDLELIVARCLQSTIFGPAMQERPHTHAALIKQHTGRDV